MERRAAALALDSLNTPLLLHSGTPLRSEVMLEDGFDPTAQFFSVIRPHALSPITITTGLGTEQMKQRIAISRVAGRNAGFQDFLIKVRAGPFHWPKHRFIASHPGITVRPTAAFHVEAFVILAQLLDDLLQALRASGLFETIPDALLQDRLYRRKFGV